MEEKIYGLKDKDGTTRLHWYRTEEEALEFNRVCLGMSNTLTWSFKSESQHWRSLKTFIGIYKYLKKIGSGGR